MPTRSERAELLVDTSVAVPLLVADHEVHDSTFKAVGARRLGLAGHAAFETFSILTRLPSPLRRSPTVVAHLLASNFPDSRFLSQAVAATLLKRLGVEAIAGGSVYDALVGAAAAEHGLTLVTRDRRAVEVYRALGTDVQVLVDR